MNKNLALTEHPATTETPSTVWAIGRCKHKGCRYVLRYNAPAHTYTERPDRFGNVRTITDIDWSAPLPECPVHPDPYGHGLAVKKILGTVNATPCDHRCTSAKGHTCECSCGGANHGADHLA